MGRGLSFNRAAKLGLMKGLLFAAKEHKGRKREVLAFQFLNFALFVHFRGNKQDTKYYPLSTHAQLTVHK